MENNKKTKAAFIKWAKAYKQGDVMWPNETLIRIVKGNYIPGLQQKYKGKKVLDVGCGTGINLLLFASLGMKLYGCEVHKDIIKITTQKLKDYGYSSEIRVGVNRELPFKSSYFDYLSSWNVIHYEDNEEKIKEAIAEYARVLKKGGRIFISTTGPTHMILEGSKYLGNHRYLIGGAGEFRKGETYFYFETPQYIQSCFSKHFDNLMVGRVNDHLFTKNQDYFIITGTKI